MNGQIQRHQAGLRTSIAELQISVARKASVNLPWKTVNAGSSYPSLRHNPRTDCTNTRDWTQARIYIYMYVYSCILMYTDVYFCARAETIRFAPRRGRRVGLSAPRATGSFERSPVCLRDTVHGGIDSRLSVLLVHARALVWLNGLVDYV